MKWIQLLPGSEQAVRAWLKESKEATQMETLRSASRFSPHMLPLGHACWGKSDLNVQMVYAVHGDDHDPPLVPRRENRKDGTKIIAVNFDPKWESRKLVRSHM